ncbi:g2813 [Coccomyxa viridis]|uniref:DNA-directed RNA polymerase subunit n=1 Tax=Coccomyxa viridis TaxID=1274662 RepID=A0ABP1FMY5_9CHLO
MAFNFFCPTCANLLLVDVESGQPLFKCQTCPYIYSVDREISREAQLKKKEVDDVLGGSDAWKNVQTTTVPCPKCGHGRAYFMEVQTRSADEPATLFFKCEECGHNWREG